MTKKDQSLAAQAWRAFGKHFRKCRICAQRDRDWTGPQQFCSVGRQLFLSEALTDEDRERLEFQARTYTLSTSRERFWKKVNGAANAAGEWISAIAGIGALLGAVWALAEVVKHVHLPVDNHWWAYQAWEHWKLWILAASGCIGFLLVRAGKIKRDPWAGVVVLLSLPGIIVAAAGGFVLFMWAIVWTDDRFGSWWSLVGMCVALFLLAMGAGPAGQLFDRLQARFRR